MEQNWTQLNAKYEIGVCVVKCLNKCSGNTTQAK